MRIEKISLGHLDNNCYIVTDERAKISALIDVGDANQQLFVAIKDLKIDTILLTHCHYDHSMGAQSIKDITGAKIAIHKNDAAGLADPDINMSCAFGRRKFSLTPDILLNDGDEIEIGSLKVKVIHTPGHTSGSICFKLEQTLFTGDTLFSQSIGRVDFPTGSAEEMKSSVNILKSLDGNLNILPGHGEPSALDIERETNPYMTSSFELL